MYMCIVPDAPDHIRRPAATLVDGKNCNKIGRQMAPEEEEQAKLKYYPLKNIVFYTQIPHLKEQVMSREFEFLLADLGMHFTSSEYIKEAIGKYVGEVDYNFRLNFSWWLAKMPWCEVLCVCYVAPWKLAQSTATAEAAGPQAASSFSCITQRAM